MEGHGFEYHWLQQPAQWVYRNCRHLSVGIYCFPPSWFSASDKRYWHPRGMPAF
eukprot:COSAG02_NODE_37449_length_441_cov_4.333333_1_plen_53_part_10